MEASRLEQFLALFGHVQYPSSQTAFLGSVFISLHSAVVLHGIGVSTIKSVVSDRTCACYQRELSSGSGFIKNYEEFIQIYIDIN